jgi:hypothetical protein
MGASVTESTVQPDSKPSKAIVRAWRTARVIVRDPAGTASLIALLAGIVVCVLPLHGDWGTGIQSVGYAVIGGAAFSFIYQFWANDALMEAIKSNMSSAQERALEEIKRTWSDAITTATTSFDEFTNEVFLMHKRHWPLDIYPEGNAPNFAFNERLEADLRQASRYDFRGQSGKHLASRLLTKRYPSLQTVRIILEDATVREVLNARIYEKRFGAPDEFAGMSSEQVGGVVLNDFLDSLIGLYLARVQFDRIEVVYARRPTDVRLEIVEGTVYVSPYTRNRPAGNRYPEVFRYDPRSVPAEIAKLEFNREFGLLGDTMLVLKPNASDNFLLEHVRSKGFELSEETFRQRYDAAERSLHLLGDEMGGSSRPPGDGSVD